MTTTYGGFKGITLNMVRAEKLARRVEVIFGRSETKHDKKKDAALAALLLLHDKVRDSSEKSYKRAMAHVVALAEADVIKRNNSKQHAYYDERNWKPDSNKSADDFAVVALAVLGAAIAESYGKAAHNLATIARGHDAGDLPTQAEEQEYAAQRVPLLEPFVRDTHTELWQEAKAGAEQGEGEKEVRARVLKKGQEIEEGRGKVVAETETQATYGEAQARALKRAGFATVTWATMEDDKVRPSHAEQDGTTVKIGDKFANGCRWPGDVLAPISETINCRCWLLGGERTKP